ncbi:MAG: serine protease [Verrucomicrobiae bacterium]|nr:serine protease [Verrucomicrobiae bacterium]
MFRNVLLTAGLGLLLSAAAVSTARAQLVGLPDPHLLTLMPMGAQRGTTVEVKIGGDHLEHVTELLFSDPGITAKPVVGEDGKPAEDRFLVTVAPDAVIGVHDARVLSRLGISSPRAFTVGDLPEQTITEPRDYLHKAAALAVNSVGNAVMPQRAIDYYTFEARKGQRYAIECAAQGIDSKLTPVVIVADAKGRDLVVNRTGGVIDFTPKADGTHVIKVNDLTFQGSDRHFYRLALQEIPAEGLPPRQPSTAKVSSTSWPPPGLPTDPKQREAEPNDDASQVQVISLPCDIGGSFYPAADVDTYEFTAKKGETWWIEVASERLGLSTDPFVLVQRVTEKDGAEALVDVAELHDIPSPLKISSNGYSYDGPPYDIGSPDVLGKVEVPEDGRYRLQVRDLFGGTRNEPANEYRLLIREAQPDFAIAAWAVHMTLRNGDRAALSKPLALRTGDATVLEVLAIRRDGFAGDIDLKMEGLPAGVHATGLKIPAGKSVGHIVVTADADAKPAFSLASITGSAVIGEETVTRPCRLATMEWPVKDAKQETPAPRLVESILVSVSDSEAAPVSFSAAEDKTWEVTEGEKLTLPLAATWREDFTGTSIKMSAYGTGFDSLKPFEVPLKAKTYDVELDLAALKTKPGDYTIAFYGGGVAKYRYHPDGVAEAEKAKQEAEAAALAAAEEAKKLAAAVAQAAPEKKAEAEAASKVAAEKQKAAEAAKTEAEKKLAAATKAAAPTDRVDIHVSTPIHIKVNPKAEATVAKTDSKP